jgi:ATP-dependent DNA helicase RecQ
MEFPAFLEQLETIVFSGTKVSIQYAIDELFDEEQQEELHEYFMESENDDIQTAVEEFDGDYDDDDLRVFRIKFMSEVAN